MNRRELLSAASAALAGVGTVNPIEAEPLPLALVVTFSIDHIDLSIAEVANIREKLGCIGIRDNQGRPIPVIVCLPGMDIKAIAIQTPIPASRDDAARHSLADPRGGVI